MASTAWRGASSEALAFSEIDPLLPTLRTIVYVDGFNLYYGAIKGSPWKWLDLVALAGKALAPHHNVVGLKYFTARVTPRSGDSSNVRRQDVYLRALRAHRPEIEIYFGHFLTHPFTARLAQPSTERRLVRVMRTEEKGSDVNLAVHLLNDAWLDAYDAAVVISNDSDLAEGMRLAKANCGKRIGVLTPGKRRTSQVLKAAADFTRQIRPGALRDSQLPNPIPGTNLRKPASW